MRNGKGNNSLKIFQRNIRVSVKEYVPQYLNFRCGMTHINCSLKKIGTIFGLQKELRKKMVRDEVFEDIWENRKEEWIDNAKNGVLYAAFG